MLLFHRIIINLLIHLCTQPGGAGGARRPTTGPASAARNYGSTHCSLQHTVQPKPAAYIGCNLLAPILGGHGPPCPHPPGYATACNGCMHTEYLCTHTQKINYFSTDSDYNALLSCRPTGLGMRCGGRRSVDGRRSVYSHRHGLDGDVVQGTGHVSSSWRAAGEHRQRDDARRHQGVPHVVKRHSSGEALDRPDVERMAGRERLVLVSCAAGPSSHGALTAAGLVTR